MPIGRVMALGHGFESVMEAAKLGSDWAWAAIYREIAGPVTGFLRARGVNDPEEAAGDVFFEISRSIESFQGNEEAFVTMVFAVAYQRVIVDRHSDDPPRSRLADRVLDRIKRDAGLEDSVVNDDLSDTVVKAFELLTQAQRDVLSLRVVGGLSVEQTASVVEQEVPTIRSLQRKALSRVRGSLPSEVVTS